MCTKPISRTFPPSVHERLLGIQSPRVLRLRCGKCMDCLRKRQNDLATRVYREARFRGSAVFVTLTYSPEDIPLASSHWRIDKHTGEMDLLEGPDLIQDDALLKEKRAEIVQYMRKSQYTNDPDLFGAVCLEEHIPIFEQYDKNHEHIIRITPTLYYKHVKDAIKRFRHHVGDFTYVCVGEYGSSKYGFNRPHYHLIFFGLTKSDCERFVLEWFPTSYTNVKQVNFFNKDNSDGLARVSRYVGKYCAKGTLDCYTARQGCTLRNRIRSSIGLGVNLTQSEIDYFLAKDIFPYDENNPFETLPKVMRKLVVDEIISRQHIGINGYAFPLPSSLIRKLYGYQRTDSKRFHLPEAYQGKYLGVFEKAIYSPIYYLVASELRSRASEDDYRKFRQMVADCDREDISASIVQVCALLKAADGSREATLKKSLVNTYCSTKLLGY